MIKFIINGQTIKVSCYDREEVDNTFHQLLKNNEGRLYEVYCDNTRIYSGPMEFDDIDLILAFCIDDKEEL